MSLGFSDLATPVNLALGVKIVRLVYSKCRDVFRYSQLSINVGYETPPLFGFLQVRTSDTKTMLSQILMTKTDTF